MSVEIDELRELIASNARAIEHNTTNIDQKFLGRLFLVPKDFSIKSSRFAVNTDQQYSVLPNLKRRRAGSQHGSG